MEGIHLGDFLSVHIDGIPVNHLLASALLLRLYGTHFHQTGKLHHAVFIHIGHIQEVVSQSLNAVGKLAGAVEVHKIRSLHHENVRDDGAVIDGAGNIHRRISAFQAADLQALDLLHPLRQADLSGTLHIAVFPAEHHRGTGRHIRVPFPNHNELLLAVTCKVRGEKFGVDGVDLLFSLATCKGVNVRDAHHLVGESAANDQFHSGTAVHIRVDHLFKGGTVHFQPLHKEVFFVLRLVENQHLQRLIGGIPGKHQIFHFSVSIQVRRLNGLLIVSHGGRGKLQAGHGLLDGGLQEGILLGPLGDAVHLLHRAVAAG